MKRDPLRLAALHRRFNDTTRPGEFTCLSCKRRFSVTAGTPMHRTHLPICTWIIATYLIATSSKGISSFKLSSLLGLQYRTMWHLTHRIRAMMGDAPECRLRLRFPETADKSVQ